MSEALRLAAWLNEGAWHAMRLGDVEAAGRELRRLAGVEAELQQAREERTAWRVTAENAEAAVKQARIDALEEAQKVADELSGLLIGHCDHRGAEIALSVRDSIRSLKETP